MAVFFNLAIDCYENELAADEFLQIYHQLVIETSLSGKIVCRAEHIFPGHHWNHPDKISAGAGDWHTVCVEPIGVAMPSTRSDLLSSTTFAEVRDALYAPLKSGRQFRSAWFGWEAQDVLGEFDWLDVLEEINRRGKLPELKGLVLAEALVTHPSVKSSLKHFCPGFLWNDQPYELN